jgi:mannosyl-3-phosphoglycerate synthase
MCELLPEGVSIYQIQSRNPHIHAERSQEHIVEMIVKSLASIYYSRLNNELVEERIRQILDSYEWNKPLPKLRVYDPRGVNPEKIVTSLMAESPDVHYFEAR